MMNEVEGWTKAQVWTFNKTQASKLGDAQGIPSSSSTTSRSSPLKLCFYHFSYYVLFLEHHFIFLSVCVILFAGHVLCWILAILCGRETRSAFSLEYSCASLIFCWVFLALFSYQLLCFAYILLRSVKFLLLDSLMIHLYLFREFFMVACSICWNDKMPCMW